MSEVHYTTDLKKFYAAKIESDTQDTLAFSKPKYFPGIKEIGIKPKINTDTGYAEGIAWDTETTIESIDVEVNMVDLSTEDEAFLLGHKIAKEGGIIYGEDDKAPEVAILVKAMKANGKARYMALYRGQFSISDEEIKGKEGKANFQSKKLKATFAPLKNNGKWKYKVDEEESMNDEKFFESVIMATEKEKMSEA